MEDSLESQASNPCSLTLGQLESKHSSSAFHDTVHKDWEYALRTFSALYLPTIRIKSFLFLPGSSLTQ